MKALIVLLALSAYGCGCPEQYRPGALIPSGDGSEALSGQHGLFYSMRGVRRVSDAVVEPASLFHAVILTPQVEIRGSGTGIDLHCLKATSTHTWTPGHWQTGPFNLPDRSLVMNYDGALEAVAIGTATYNLTQGNYFLVRLDSSWQATSIQLPVVYRAAASLREAFDHVRAALPNDTTLQSLQLHSEPAAARTP